jgi:endonuclease/exonuclease/phosphatase family metal-dependent hydrolase
MPFRRALRRLSTLVLLALGACGDSTSPGNEPGICYPVSPMLSATVPAEGTAGTFDVVGWNIEWFGDTRAGFGPADDALQQQNVRDVMAGVDADLWAVQEIVDLARWNALEASLPGYAGFLASEANVADGAAFYTASEQKVGILYKTSVVTVTGARLILTASNTDFGGRPPLEVTMRVTVGGSTQDLVLIVLHMKAFADAASWQSRVNAAAALKAYLDATYPTQRVLVAGDFNDDIDLSIDPSRDTPYRAFVNDAARYRFTTAPLSATPGVSSTTGFPEVIDHHLATNELHDWWVSGSAKVLRPDAQVTGYASTTSDHYPVLTRYTIGTSAGATLALVSPNGGERWTGGSTRDITWTSSGVTTVRIEYTPDGGTTWRLVTASADAAAGRHAWRVPGEGTTVARVRVRDLASATADESDAAFTIVAGTAGAGQVIVNELLPNARAGDLGEFVELVNAGAEPADISGWTLETGGTVRHRFADGDVLAPGLSALVHDGLAVLVGIPPSSGALALPDEGGTLVLRDGAGAVRDAVSWTAGIARPGVSINRSPDAAVGGAFVAHTRLGACRASPGVRASGDAFVPLR